MQTISGTFYRCDSEYSLKGLKVLHVLEYEANELKNKDAKTALKKLTDQENRAFSIIPANRLIWCCKEKSDAFRYARDEDGQQVNDIALIDDYVTPYNVRDGLQIIPDDGDGGMLILLKPN